VAGTNGVARRARPSDRLRWTSRWRKPGGTFAASGSSYTVVGIWITLSLMWFAIDMLDDSSSLWFYWPMLGTGIGVVITAIVLLGIGGLFGVDWERREMDRYLRRRGREPRR
jgi:2TM domain